MSYFSLKQFLVFSFLGLCSLKADAQVFFAQKQSTVDSFPILAGNVDLYGSIILNGGADTSNDIHDLTPLLQLKVLTGGLYIVHTTRLKSLHGLDSLIYIGGLLINNNDSLKNLSGLNPKYIYSSIVEITQNKGLEEIKGLHKHEELYDFRIKENPRLKVINGLQSLRFCPYISFSNNQLLEQVSMSNLQKTGDLWLYKNSNLQTLSFPKLDSLIYFESRITIWGSPRLKNLDALKNLDTLRSDSFYTSGWIYIDSTGLEDISAIKNIHDCGLEPNLRFLNSHRLEKVEFLNLSQSMEFWAKNCHQLNDIQLPSLHKLFNDDGSVFLLLDNLPALYSLDGIRNLKTVAIPPFYAASSKIRIKNNPSLTDCDAVCKLRTTIAASYFDLQSNAFPCNTLAEIEDNVCDSLSHTFSPENTTGSQIRVSPNPAQDFIDVEWSAYPENPQTEYTLTLVSSLGQIVCTQKIYSEKSSVEVSQMPSGFYFLRLSCGGRVFEVGKVLILR